MFRRHLAQSVCLVSVPFPSTWIHTTFWVQHRELGKHPKGQNPGLKELLMGGERRGDMSTSQNSGRFSKILETLKNRVLQGLQTTAIINHREKQQLGCQRTF